MHEEHQFWDPDSVVPDWDDNISLAEVGYGLFSIAAALFVLYLSDLTCIRRDAEPTEPQRTQSGVNVTTEFSASAHRVCSRWRREHCELSISTHS